MSSGSSETELPPNPLLTRDEVRLLKTDKVVSGRGPTLECSPDASPGLLPVLRRNYGASAAGHPAEDEKFPGVFSITTIA